MKKIFLFFISLYFLTAQQIVPEWFKVLPQHDPAINLAVGYTGKYRDRQLAQKAALNQARKNLAKQLRVRLIFEIQEISDGYYRLIQPTFEEIYYENLQAHIDTNSFVLDSVFVEDRCYILLSTDDNFTIKRSQLSNWGEKPIWTDSLPKKSNFVYGVGIVANYSYWKNGWQDADEYARFDACKNLKLESSSIRTEKRTGQYTINRKILRQSVDISVANSKIIERWYDIQRNVFYSLCRIPIQSPEKILTD
ncbi:MAG: hypothetical protein K9M80_01425 [Candidatus Marinimicrobia bacterium]|nr:hypothetical protein [Candidatus Neomarinimicrobiota bacterium]